MAAPATSIRPRRRHEAPNEIPWREFPFRGRRLMAIVAALIAFVAFGSIVGKLILGPLASSVGELDLSISQWMGAHRTPRWDSLTWWGSTLADSWVKIPAAVVLVVLFVARWKRWFEAALLGGALILESTAFVVTSFIVGRERPPIEQLDSIPPTGSFPSGHTAAAVVFYGAIALIVWANSSSRVARATAATAAVVVPVIVGTARVYRGMHFTSDVVFGAILGVATLAATWWLLTTKRRSYRNVNPAVRRTAAEPMPSPPLARHEASRLTTAGATGGAAPVR